MLITIENLLSDEELAGIHQALDAAVWTAGANSAGLHAKTHKRNEEMDQSCASWTQINQHVITRLYEHPEFQRCALPVKVSAAYISRYSEGMRYGSHVDDAVMGAINARYRSDIAVTVFLSNPDTYVGGELQIQTHFGPVAVKAAAGSAVLYPASSRHEVSEITQGTRIAAVLWAQSLVRDPAQREILADLDAARQALTLSAPEAQVTQTVDHTYMNLVRMWSDV